MLKKIISLAIAVGFAANAATAQNEWQAPTKVKTSENAKSTDNAADKAVKETTTVEVNGKKTKIEPKYYLGAVPEVDGKVEWQWTFNMPGRSADEAYHEMMKLMEELTTSPEQTDRSAIAVVNPQEHIIAANMVEQLDFSQNFISHDFTIFRYSLICQTFKGKATMRFCRLVYDYDKGRKTEATYTAENLITDKESLNKSKTKFYPLNGKFRRKTIDRAEVLKEYFEAAIRDKK